MKIPQSDLNLPLQTSENSQLMWHPVSQDRRKALAEPGSWRGESKSFNPKQSMQMTVSAIKLSNNVQQQKLKLILGQLWI